MSGGRDAGASVELRDFSRGSVAGNATGAPAMLRRLCGLSDDAWERLGGAVSVEQAPDQPRLRGILRRAAPLVVFTACLALLAGSDVPAPASANSRIEEQDMKIGALAFTATIAVVSSVGSEARAQNLLVNGGLEGADGPCASPTVSPGSAAIPGWVVSGNWNVDWIRSPIGSTTCNCPFDGMYLVDLNGSPNTVSGSAIRQTVVTAPGSRYRLSLAALSNPFNTAVGTVKTLRVTTGGTVTDLAMVTGDGNNWSSCADWPWETREVIFEAVGTSTVIELRSTFPNNAGGIFIDAVSLTALVCPGDIDDSGFVDGVDLAIILTNWGTPNPKYPEADVDADGEVNASDLATVLSGWGACP